MASRVDVEVCKNIVSLFAQFATTQDEEMIRRYLDAARKFEDGKLDEVLPHFLPISEMRGGQEALKFMISILENVLVIKKLTDEYMGKDKVKSR